MVIAADISGWTDLLHSTKLLEQAVPSARFLLLHVLPSFLPLSHSLSTSVSPFMVFWMDFFFGFAEESAPVGVAIEESQDPNPPGRSPFPVHLRPQATFEVVFHSKATTLEDYLRQVFSKGLFL
ncbi:uncharacterized protein [Elaeis guineensis]|uniref:uncharacterized protein n=1 Tax=Elaeis guineensis var. tenera TaxID=51953 RepID=UPI00094FFDA2